MKGTEIFSPVTPVWMPNMMLAEESMQSPKVLNSTCSKVILHSVIDVPNFRMMALENCGGRWMTKAWRWHLDRSSCMIVDWMVRKLI